MHGPVIVSPRRDRRPILVLVLSNLLGGIGVASGVAVGGLIAEDLGGTAFAGLGQGFSVLGAAIAAVPLARVAQARGRRVALSLGYVLAAVGAALVVVSVIVGQLLVLLLGLGLFGASTAVNLQSRYAAADYASGGTRARSMSVVIWATTVGAVAGPNLTAPVNEAGLSLGMPNLTGPYLFSIAAFGLGALVLGLLLPRASTPVAGAAPQPDAAPVGALAALRWAMRDPQARYGVVLIACAHSVMVLVMVMTPVHMQHHGMSLQLVGVVISLHVLGMYALSPVFGVLADRWGAVPVSRLGLVVLAASLILGFLAGDSSGSSLTAVALVALGVGWSACLIAASAHLTTVATDEVRVPLQGATDAGMSYAGALAAVLAGPVLAWGGFEAINVLGLVLLLPAVLVGLVRARQPATATQPSRWSST